MDDPGLPRPIDGDAETIRLQAEEHPLIEEEPPATPAEHCLRLMHLRAYDEAVRHASGRDVLDVGCNTGYGTIRFARVARRVVGVDVSPRAIEAARERASDGRPEFLETSGFDLPFPAGTFDLVTSFQVLEHVPDAPAFLRELARVARPGGMVILATPNAATRLYPGMTPWNRFHVHEYRADELAELLGTVFARVRVLGMVGTPELYETEIRRVDAARQRIRRKEEAAARQEAARSAAAARAEARVSAPPSRRPWPIRVARAVVPRPIRAWLRSVAGPRPNSRPRSTAETTTAAPAAVPAAVAASAPERPVDLEAFLRFTVDDLWYDETDLDRSMDLLALCEVHSATGPGALTATV
jgi:2-polyprenyl-3-methyl-5-hydroxy-6-metoxy-1,4-benzoquinol methylase